ncbi:AGC/PDK1 protein kinase [Coprinopsis sp. MPI-PUGE-AT-0042]|nr:AGC/PDK1 protein kinase [Coprinopsis sp. MPI-PUGE-AT-0042]
MTDSKVVIEDESSERQLPTLSDFEVGEELAWGSLATIVEGVHKKTGKTYAIKILNKMQLSRRKMVRSAMVEKDALIALAQHPHPGIIRLHFCFQDAANLYFVLDLAPNEDLKVLTLKTGSLSLECARYYTAQMVDAILLMHTAGIAHRDIKPENCLLDQDMRIKLADFGSAYVSTPSFKGHRTNTFVGTAAFLSPEVLLRSSANPTGPDLWAVGACLYFYIFGTYPFAGATDYLIMERIKRLDYSIPEACDPDAADLIKRLLVHNFEERLGLPPNSSPEEIRRHPFFVGPSDSSDSNGETKSSYIDWETLWTIDAPEIKPGPFKEAPKQHSEKEQEKMENDLWAKFEEIHLVEEGDSD